MDVACVARSAYFCKPFAIITFLNVAVRWSGGFPDSLTLFHQEVSFYTAVTTKNHLYQMQDFKLSVLFSFKRLVD